MVPWTALDEEVVRASRPWRRVRHFRGQKHLPGWYWSERIGRRLMYESRLEMARLMVADFNPRLVDIREQVFHLTMTLDDGSVVRHIPDFFISIEGEPPRLVNVKPPGWEEDGRMRETFEALGALCAQKGWWYETWTGQDRIYLENLRWLTGYRRRVVIPATDEEISSTLGLVTEPTRVGDLERRARVLGIVQPRPVLMHAIWMSLLNADLTVALSSKSEVWR